MTPDQWVTAHTMLFGETRMECMESFIRGTYCVHWPLPPTPPRHGPARAGRRGREAKKRRRAERECNGSK